MSCAQGILCGSRPEAIALGLFLQAINENLSQPDASLLTLQLLIKAREHLQAEHSRSPSLPLSGGELVPAL